MRNLAALIAWHRERAAEALTRAGNWTDAAADLRLRLGDRADCRADRFLGVARACIADADLHTSAADLIEAGLASTPAPEHP